MRPSPRLWTRLALAVAMMAAGAGAVLANAIAVPLGTGSVQCDATHPNANRFAGSCGAQVSIVGGDTTAAFVQENSLSNETSYRVRFNANLLRLPMVGSDSLDIFVVYDGADPTPPTVAGNAVIRVAVQVSGGIKQLVVYTRLNDGSYADTTAAPVRLVDGYRTIELEWAAGSPGHLNIWIDGFLCNGADQASAGSGAGACASLSGLVNSNQRGHYARWGAPANVNVSVSGTFNLDDFASQRSGYIGPAIPFPNDTPTSNAAWRAIQGIYENGLTGGCAIGTYCGELFISRRQMAVFVVRAKYGADYIPPAATGIFTDVPPASNFANFVEQIYNDGIDLGCGPGPTFCPETNMDRTIMAVWLLRAEHGGGYSPPVCSSPTFSDVPCNALFADFIYQLAAEGITLGCGPSLYCPAAKVTRGQMALFLQRTYKCPTGPSALGDPSICIALPQVGP